MITAKDIVDAFARNPDIKPTRGIAYLRADTGFPVGCCATGILGLDFLRAQGKEGLADLQDGCVTQAAFAVLRLDGMVGVDAEEFLNGIVAGWDRYLTHDPWRHLAAYNNGYDVGEKAWWDVTTTAESTPN